MKFRIAFKIYCQSGNLTEQKWSQYKGLYKKIDEIAVEHGCVAWKKPTFDNIEKTASVFPEYPDLKSFQNAFMKIDLLLFHNGFKEEILDMEECFLNGQKKIIQQTLEILENVS